MNKLFSIVQELLKNNISILSCELKNNSIAFKVEIGSKTGTGLLYEESDQLFLETRYNKIEKVDTFQDISTIAFYWYLDYRDRESYNIPNVSWLEIWLKEGRIEEKNKTITEYVIK